MADLDLTFEGASEIVNGVTFTADESIVSGTGGYFTFLSIQNNGGTEEGYNHDVTGGTTVLDTGNSKTRSVLISQLEVVDFGGTDYYVLRLDMNEPGNASGTESPINLLEFKLYTSAAVATATDFDANRDGAGDGGLVASFTKFYDLDDGGGNTLQMRDLSSGSGGDDYQVLIPTDIVTAGTYFTLYWKFDTAQSGFEEARALTIPNFANPEIDIIKYVSVDGGATWDDANAVTGPYALATDDIQFKFVVTNTGTVDLTDVEVDDDVFDLGLGGNWLIGALGAGLSDELILDIDELTQFTVGQHVNTATVTGLYGATEVSDFDLAHYFGAVPDIDVEKYVSVDGGTTWLDADTTTGPYALPTNDIKFKFVVTNTGNVALTDVVIEDSDFDIDVGVGTTWLVGALAVDGTDELIFDLDELTQFTIGQHVNTAIAIGSYGTTDVSDTDDAHYWGVLGEGLSHGYWKNHGPDDGTRNDWDVSPVEASSFETFFGIANPASYTWVVGSDGKKPVISIVQDISFEQALGLTGGGQQALAREAVAAILNSRDEDIEYGYTEGQIIDLVQDAFAFGTYEVVKNLLENENTSGNWM